MRTTINKTSPAKLTITQNCVTTTGIAYVSSRDENDCYIILHGVSGRE
jgi:hypothetical protein